MPPPRFSKVLNIQRTEMGSKMPEWCYLHPLDRIPRNPNCKFGFKSSQTLLIKSDLLHAHCAGCITRVFEALLGCPNFELVLGLRLIFPSCESV